MSILSSWIEKTYKHKYVLHDSKTTDSKYYTINGYDIRISNHFSQRASEERDMNIILPMNSNTCYLVIKKNQCVPMTYSFHELKFIIDWEVNNAILKQSSKNVEQAKINVASNKVNSINDEILNDPESRIMEHPWGVIVQYDIMPLFGKKWAKLKQADKNIVKDFVSNSNNKDYKKCIKAIKYANELPPSNISPIEILKQYFNFYQEDLEPNVIIKNIIKEINHVNNYSKSGEKIPSMKSLTETELKNHPMRGEELWSGLVNYVINDFPFYRSLSKHNRQIVKALFADKSIIEYDECIEMLNDIHKNYQDDYTLITKLLAA